MLLSEEAGLKRKSIFAKLITLHPRPKKEILLPYIEDSQLSIVCINLLLGGDRFSPDALRPRAFSSASKAKRSGSFQQCGGEAVELSG